MEHYFNPSAEQPLRHLASAILIVRGYSLDPDRTREQDEFMSVSLDDYEAMLIEQLSCVTMPEDDAARDAFLDSCGLSYMIPDMRRFARELRVRLSRDCFFPDDMPFLP